MTFQTKSVIGWAFVMVAFNIIPYATTTIAEPSSFQMVGMMICIGLVAGVIGNLFKD